MTQPLPADLELARAIAAELEAAEVGRAPVDPLTDRHPRLDVAMAYAIQRATLERRLERGVRLIGRKVGLTNIAMQQQLGVDQPDFGHLLDAMLIPAGASFDTATLISPRVEPEVCFRLNRDLAGDGVTADDVLAATDGVAPALEIIDSRIVDWRIKLVDTVADNASSARVVVGDFRPIDRPELDLVTMAGTLRRDGEIVGSGTGAAVLGHPAAAVAWLVGVLALYGEGLRAGDIVIPGAMCASVPFEPGHRYAAEIDGLGSVSVRTLGDRG
jgi:2-keto-4-pentenoate hydratase